VTWGDEVVDELYCRRASPTDMPDQDRCKDEWKQCRASGKCGIGPMQGQAPGLDLFAWPAPVVAGCVLRASHDSTAVGANACDFKFDPEDRDMPRLISRLFVLKPALDLATAKDQLISTEVGKVAVGAHIAGDFCDAGWRARNDLSIARCNFGVGERSGSKRPDAAVERLKSTEVPCAALAHLVRDKCSSKDIKNGILRPKFPQDNFVSLTLNSSYLMFGAYFDLGRHQASSLLGTPIPANPLADLEDSFDFLLNPNKSDQRKVEAESPSPLIH
jgi:hypothetical protein